MMILTTRIDVNSPSNYTKYSSCYYLIDLMIVNIKCKIFLKMFVYILFYFLSFQSTTIFQKKV